MKNPNGYGSVYKLSGKRRKPWIAVKTGGWITEGEKAKQKREVIGYYEKREEAMKALADNQDVTKLQLSKTTFRDVWTKYLESDKYKRMTEASRRHYKLLIEKWFNKIFDMEFSLITPLILQNIFDESSLISYSKKTLRSILKNIFQYAIKFGIANQDCSALIDVGSEPRQIERKVFAPEEIRTMLQNYKNKFIAGALIMIYTSMRASEMLSVEKTNVNFDQRYITGGIKTKAGKNRVFPIHDDIVDVVHWLMETSAGPKLINITYASYVHGMRRALAKLNLPDHTTHDCRHTFFSIADRDGLNPSTIKIIGGHASFDTSEKIYVHRNPSELVTAINHMNPQK